MSRNVAKLIPSQFPQLPGLDTLKQLQVHLDDADAAPVAAYVLFDEDGLPEAVPFTSEQLALFGYEPKCANAVLVPVSGAKPVVVIGGGKRSDLTGPILRDIAAAAANAVAKFDGFALHVPADVPGAARFIVEGAALARYRYTALKSDPKVVELQSLWIDVPQASQSDVETGLAASRATIVARDLINTPPGHLTADDLSNAAKDLAAQYGFDIEIFGKEELIELGCGGLLGVNRGSYEPPRMIKLHFKPENPTKHVGLVGKGITYDSGGVSLKPSDSMHLLMKMDMGGAGAIVGTFTALKDLNVPVEVTAWLMCTDNMISGDAYRLGDVLVAADGTTVEVKNTDAEGRLVLMDGLSLAVREGVDTIVDIATLTGAAVVALGTSLAATYSTDEELAEALDNAAEVTGECAWRMPLVEKYRKDLDSVVADISNASSTRFGGSITAALFLKHFVGGKPWAHIDIAGPMSVDSSESWRPVGATGVGARLLLSTLQGM